MSGDDSSAMVMMLLAACCCSSSSVSLLGGGGAAFALLRSRQAAPAEDTPAEDTPVAAAPRTPKPARTIRSGGRAIRKAFRKPGRSIRKAFRKPVRSVRKAFRKPTKSIRKAFRKFKRPRFCFSPKTLIQRRDGTTAAMEDLNLGDVLVNGSVVNAVMRIRNENDPYYKINDILVTGKHHVKYENNYIQVMNLPGAIRTEIVDDELCCLVTSDHKIPVGDFTFWDWEDNLIAAQ